MEFAIIRPPLVYGPGIKANFAALMRAVQRLCGNLQVDISKARSLLGWLPQTSVDEGLRRAMGNGCKKSWLQWLLTQFSIVSSG